MRISVRDSLLLAKLSRDTATDGPKAEVQVAVDQEVTVGSRLLEMWRETLGNEELTMDDDPLQLGATSMQIMSIVGRLAEEMSIEVPIEAMFDAITIGEQAAALTLGLPA
jgi:acyl carrier protein